MDGPLCNFIPAQCLAPGGDHDDEEHSQTAGGLILIYSLRSEDPKFEFCCTQPRTNWDHQNAFS